MGRIVGIDFGLVRIGVSLSDNHKIIASAFGKVQSKRQFSDTIEALRLLLHPYKDEIELIIIGNPLHLNGKESPMSQVVAHFKSQLESHLPYKVLLWDERLSSSQAEKLLKEELHRK